MGTGEQLLEQALSETLDNKLDSPEEVPASLGAYINGQKTISVNDQPDYVWVRIAGNTSQRAKAFNSHAGGVASHWDLPIIITKDRINPDIWKVVGRDVRRYESWISSASLESSSPYLPAHGSDHSFSAMAGTGNDPTWVFKRQFMPMLPHPAPTGTMGIKIGSDFYYYGGRYRWFASTGTVDFTAQLPTGAANGRFITIYIDGETGNPAYLTGTEINTIYPPIDPGEFIPIPSSLQGVPLAAVFLLTGTSRIGWGEIYDLRFPNEPVQGTGSFLGTFDEGAFLGEIDELDFVGAGVSSAFAGGRTTVTISGGGLGGTRLVVGLPTSLGDGATGIYWNVPDFEYYTGSLAVALGGVVQTPSVDYDEQHPGSGTYEFLVERPPTGSVQTVWYGVEV